MGLVLQLFKNTFLSYDKCMAMIKEYIMLQTNLSVFMDISGVIHKYKKNCLRKINESKGLLEFLLKVQCAIFYWPFPPARRRGQSLRTEPKTAAEIVIY